ncbi:hypothetical protein B0T25DRAFT_348437 [Lasiosphaeria hispida]|uniref:Uncharacterized protein n=1 Tax=Lasiosphaeria hispida TaxID=260671 RepID=A0AAJ0M8C2_9PEZI|nr:hypothetical protein B0T25DRAFT_348437 [Lasiosphaeria hispida]
MAPTSPPSAGGSDGRAQSASINGNGSASAPFLSSNLTQALKDLARGEQTAAALEQNLTSLESKLDELLASLDVPPEEEEGGEGASPVTRHTDAPKDESREKKAG